MGSTEPQPKHQRNQSRRRPLLIAVLVVAVLASVVFGRAYRAFKIPTVAMEPTLIPGDHVYVNALAYGIHIPFTDTVLRARPPKRGDVVIFRIPGRGDVDTHVNRIIGLPGDVVEVRNRRITLNGTALPTHDFPLTELDPEGYPARSGVQGKPLMALPFEETIGEHHHGALALDAPGFREQVPPKEGRWTVQPGHVFVIGDNRDDSEDSRFGREEGGFGQVPIANLVGRVEDIYMSLDKAGFRSGRAFKHVE